MNPMGALIVILGILLIATGWSGSQGRIWSAVSGSV